MPAHRAPNPKPPPSCAGNPSFKPKTVFDDSDRLQEALDWLHRENSLYQACRVLFNLPHPDDYTYHAIASVTLAEVQHAIDLGASHNLHAWYRNPDRSPGDKPSPAEIDAYIALFLPSTASPAAALTNLGANARKGSIRSQVADRLSAKRYLHPPLSKRLTIPKCRSPPSRNPYLDFWAWSCRNLEWCGPCDLSDRAPLTSHHLLPVLMHHFGCVTPSHESLEVLRILADGRPIADLGSGNGYWSLMLRRYGLTVHAVDNMQSAWRVNWLDDTVVADGVQWLRRHAGASNMVLLTVYPVVGQGPVDGAFIRGLIDAFAGDTLAVVGTQNSNGYTTFRTTTMDEYMRAEHKDWTKVVQIALPSFAGKDEALYVFQRGARVAG